MTTLVREVQELEFSLDKSRDRKRNSTGSLLRMLTRSSSLVGLLLKIQVYASGSLAVLITNSLTVKELQQKSFYAILFGKVSQDLN